MVVFVIINDYGINSYPLKDFYMVFFKFFLNRADRVMMFLGDVSDFRILLHMLLTPYIMFQIQCHSEVIQVEFKDLTSAFCHFHSWRHDFQDQIIVIKVPRVSMINGSKFRNSHKEKWSLLTKNCNKVSKNIFFSSPKDPYQSSIKYKNCRNEKENI